MNAATVLVRCLEQEGVETIFAVPGEENLLLLEALRRSSITVVLCRHEQAAGFMAATTGRLTGRVGVCLTTLGPGACNVLTAAAHAQLGGMPMLVISGQKPLTGSEQGAFQVLDIVGMMQPVTSYSRRLASVRAVAPCVREAFRRALSARPGCVHLELPEDVAAETCGDGPLPSPPLQHPRATEAAITAAAALLREARRPLLLLGSGACRGDASGALAALVDALQLPFVSTQMGKGAVDEAHPCNIGCAALSSGDFVHRAFAVADLIVTVGHDIAEKPPLTMTRGGSPVLHLAATPARIDPVYFPQHHLIGDIADAAARLRATIGDAPDWQRGDFFTIRDALRGHRQALIEAADGEQIEPPQLVEAVRRAAGPAGCVALDNGLYKLWFARHFDAARPGSLLLDNALATMGAGLPSAIAARRLEPGRPVFAVCGDGGLMMSSQALETAVRLGLDLIVVVVVDGAYGMIRWKQELDGLPEHGLRFGNPDFVQLARAYGGEGRCVTAPEALLPALDGALAAGGLQVVAVRVDYSRSTERLGDTLAEQSAALSLHHA